MDDSISLEGEAEPARSPLGRLEADLARELVAERVVSEEQLASARARNDGYRLSTRLWSLGLVSEEELRDVFSRCLRVPVAHPDAVVAGAGEWTEVLTSEDIERFRLIPYAGRDDALLVATCEPWRLALFEDLADQISRSLQPCFLDEAPLARLLEQFHGLAADPLFLRQPELQTRPLLPSPDAADEEKDGPGEELMSETQFDRMYQR
jgi:hypothetical protein